MRIIKWLESKRGFSWFLTLFSAGLIFYISSLTFNSSYSQISFLSTLYHFIAFFFFSFFFLLALVAGKNPSLVYLALIISFLYAISDEVHQLFVPGRAFSFYDILIDFLGVGFSTFIYVQNLKKRKIKKNLEY